MKYIIVKYTIITLVFAALIPPPPPNNVLDPVNGVALIGWENDVGADAVDMLLDRDDCRGPTPATIKDSGDPQQALVQVPAGPPFRPACLLRPGDHVYLLRYKGGEYIDQIGPYVVPWRVYLPTIKTL